MSARVLVAYATRYGSTQEVAEAIGTALREAGLEVEVRPARQVDDIAAYDAVVLGGWLYAHHWHKDAIRFLSRHRGPLGSRRTAVFALGPVTEPRKEQEWLDARAQLDEAHSGFSWLQPVAVEIMGGRFDPALLGFPMKLFAAAAPASDIRDWDAIRAWATGLAPLLQTKR